MMFRERLLTVGTLFVFALTAYGIGRYYSSSLVAYVVAQTLIQKAPAGVDPAFVKARLASVLARRSEEKEKLAELLSISQYLEKVQRLNSTELDQLLGKESREPQ